MEKIAAYSTSILFNWKIPVIVSPGDGVADS
jgi:hypothetical protein